MVIECNTEVDMETNRHSQAPKLKTKTKWPTVVLALSSQNDVEKQKENAKTQNTLKAHQHG